MPNETHLAPPRYTIPDFFSSLLVHGILKTEYGGSVWESNLLSASRQASFVCRYSRLCGCPRDAEVRAELSDPLARSAAGSSKNAETCASQSCQDRYEYRLGAGSCSGLSTATEAFRSRRDSGIANRCPQPLARFLPYIRAGDSPAHNAPANSCLSWPS